MDWENDNGSSMDGYPTYYANEYFELKNAGYDVPDLDEVVLIGDI